MKPKFLHIIWEHMELLIWVAGLTIVVLSNPWQEHFTVCIIKMLGLGYCPGCGLGHSIGFLARGEIKESLHAHPLGIPAFIFILMRIIKLSKRLYINTIKTHSRWTLYL